MSFCVNLQVAQRFNISCHDFRANEGESDFFRTKEYILKILKDNNYDIKTYSLGHDWIYAEQKN